MLLTTAAFNISSFTLMPDGEIALITYSDGVHRLTAADVDGDGIAAVSDNCPDWANPGKVLPSWPVPNDDPTARDSRPPSRITLAPAQSCLRQQPGLADINSDHFYDITDISAVRGTSERRYHRPRCVRTWRRRPATTSWTLGYSESRASLGRAALPDLGGVPRRWSMLLRQKGCNHFVGQYCSIACPA